jgi:hypothetical protein
MSRGCLGGVIVSQAAELLKSEEATRPLCLAYHVLRLCSSATLASATSPRGMMAGRLIAA